MLSLLPSRKSPARRKSSSSAAATPIADAVAADVHKAKQARLAELNQALATLSELFPGTALDEFRRLLLESSEESRLHVVTELLLRTSRDRSGSRKASAEAGAGTAARLELEPWEKFRSDDYQAAVFKLLCKEFKGLSRSTVQAVMAENNHDYRRCRGTLREIADKSWRFSFSNFFRRSLSSKASSSSVATASTAAIPTGSEELDDELFALAHADRPAQIAADRELAVQLNEEEAAAAEELVECECCYGDYAWEQTASCTSGHFFCHGCLVRSVQEGVYGQGRNLAPERGTVRCISAAAAPCDACVALDVLYAALPADVLAALDARNAAESLEMTGLPLVRCSFCGYAEVDEPRPFGVRPQARYALLAAVTVLALLVSLVLDSSLVLALLVGAIGLASTLYSSVVALPASWPPALGRIERIARRVQVRRRGTLFKCANPQCKKESCIECSKEWRPFHKCFQKEEDGVRIHVEKAMAEAVKRTCPRCRVSFVKSDGCNKLRCPCGYVMCYICRADIRSVGYRHFCQHFRVNPGTPCAECDSCNLYAVEDEAGAIRKAARDAEDDYWRRNSKPDGWKWSGSPGGVPGAGGAQHYRSIREVGEAVGEALERVAERVFDWVLE